MRSVDIRSGKFEPSCGGAYWTVMVIILECGAWAPIT